MKVRDPYALVLEFSLRVEGRVVEPVSEETLHELSIEHKLMEEIVEELHSAHAVRCVVWMTERFFKDRGYTLEAA